MDGSRAIPFGDRQDRVGDAAGGLAARIDGRLEHAYRLAAVILGSPTEAEDAVADAALSAWRSGSSLRDEDRFDAWFDRILVNGCRDRLRSRRRHPIVPIDIAALGAGRESADFRTGVDTRDAITRALEAIEPDEQAVIVLRFWADLPIDAIAQRLGIPAGTVKSRLNRALARLRAAMTTTEGDR